MKKFLLFLCLIVLFSYRAGAQHQAGSENLKETAAITDSLDREKMLYIAPPFLYDALSEFKGVSLHAQGFLFKDIYSRGFNSSGRFTQVVDGIDSRLPGLNFAWGNIGGIPAIDIGEVKLAPGIDGIQGASLIINSKNPFAYQGLSAHYRIGMNHAGSLSQKASPWETMALRYARTAGRFAFKTAISYTQGEDWQSQDISNFDRINMTMQAGNRETDPSYDGVNLYGDEPGNITLNQAGRNIKDKYPGIPCGCIPEPEQSVVRAYNEGLLPKLAVTRTGYPEQEVLDNYTNSFKVSGALHYRLSSRTEASLQAAWGSGSGTYTNFDRYALKNFNIGQYKIEISSSDLLLRAYTIIERSGNSYNASLLGSMINEAWKPSETWMQQYTLAYAKERLAGTAEQRAHLTARAAADEGRPQAGSAAYNMLKEELASGPIGTTPGAKLIDRSNLFHFDAAYDFSRLLRYKFNLKAGASLRKYQPESAGTLFNDADRNIQMDEYSGFIELGKTVNPGLKFTGSVRYDKSSNFKPLYSPGIRGMYSLKNQGRIWAAYQLRYLNPSIQEQYLDYAMGSGNMQLAGGLPEMIEKYGLYSNRAYTAESYRRYQASNGSSILNEYFFDPEGVQPERIQSVELRYSGKLHPNLQFNASAYYSIYSNYISQVDVYQRADPAEGLGQMRRFLIPVNINEDLNSWGGGLGVTYSWKKLQFDANTSYSHADDLPASYSGGFNIPDIMFNAGISSREIVKNFGFKAVYRWQDNFYWRSGFVNGQVPAFGTLDGQLSYKLPQYNAVLKLGGANLLNKYYITSYGNPLIGGMYYFSILFDQLIK